MSYSPVYRRYLYVLGILTLVPMLIMSFTIYQILFNNIVLKMRDMDTERLQQAVNKIDMRLHNIDAAASRMLVNLTGYNDDLIDLPLDEIHQINDFNNIVFSSQDYLRSFYIYNAHNDRFIVNNQFHSWKHFYDWEWLDMYQKSQNYRNPYAAKWFSRRITLNSDGYAFNGLSLVRSMPSEDGYSSWYTVINIDIARLLTDVLVETDNVHYVIFTPSGQHVFSSEKNFNPNYTNSNSSIYDGQNYINVSAHSKLNGWVYVSYIPQSTFDSLLTPLTLIIRIIIGLGVLLLTMAVLLASRFLYEPLCELVNIINAYLPHPKHEMTGIPENEFEYIRQNFISSIYERDNAKRELQNYKPLIYENEIRKLISNGYTISDSNSVTIPLFDGMNEFVAVVVEDFIGSHNDTKVQSNWNRIWSAVKDIFAFSFHYTGASITPWVSCIILCFEHNGEFSYRSLEVSEQCKRLLDKLNNLGLENLSIGIGTPVDLCSSISDSYQQALQASKYRVYAEGSLVLFYEELFCQKTTPMEAFPIEIQDRLIAAIKERNIELAKSYIGNLIEKFSSIRITPEYLYTWFAFIRDVLFAIPLSCGYECEEIVGDSDVLYQEIWKCGTLGDFHKYLARIALVIIEGLDRKSSNRTNQMVQEIKKFVLENIGEDISLNTVADKFGFTPSYLSTLFKQETGENFSKYIMALRMEFATRLLSETNITIKQVAEKVGYFNESRFYIVFKKFVGRTPNQYRQEKQVQQHG